MKKNRLLRLKFQIYDLNLQTKMNKSMLVSHS